MVPEKYIHVRVENVTAVEGNSTNSYPESSDSKACCFGQLSWVWPVVRKKDIQDGRLTTIEGLGKDLIHETILVDLEKECQCKGRIVAGDMERTIQLKGDRELQVKNFLVREGLATPEPIND